MTMQDPMADMLTRIRNAQRAKIADVSMPTSTFKVGVAEVLKEEGLADRAFGLGQHALSKLKQIDSPLIKAVRGKGLLIGIELKPEAGGARSYCMELMQQGILCWETHEHVIRLTLDKVGWMARPIARPPIPRPAIRGVMLTLNKSKTNKPPRM